MTPHDPRAHRWPSRALACTALLCVTLGLARSGSAATARITWQPRGAGAVTGYNVYARNAGAPYGTVAPVWTGNPAPAGDGSMSATVTFTPSSSGTNYFAVTALSTMNGETTISGELPIGTSNPCRSDSCSTKTTCNFSNRTDGTSCDDALYCNGPEVCVAGVCDTSPVRNCADSIACTTDACDETNDRCTHAAPPGCCAACDSNDPCLAAACAQGDCSAELGTEIEVNRVKFQTKKSGIKLAAKGRFLGDPDLDPTTTGAVLEMRAADGTVMYSSSISAQSIKAGASGGRFRYAVTSNEADVSGNGVTRLDLRLKADTWLLTVKAETPELVDAFLEPTLTWVLKLGATCVRRMDMACDQTDTRSICR